jgi:hypothetical protein
MAAGVSPIVARRRDMGVARHRARSRLTDIVEDIMTMTYVLAALLPVADPLPRSDMVARDEAAA